MAHPQPKPTAMYRLPPELLLQITDHLRPETASDLVHLRNLCLVSRKLLPIAREQLYANAELSTSCGCHPTVNSALQLLRTLLEHPALVHHVKALRFSVVRRNVGKLYQDEYPNKHLDLPALRDLCAGQLANLGYSEEHPWMVSLRNNVESAYAGLLLCILPNLAKLQYAVKELHRGCGVVDPIPAFFATCYPPATLASAFKANLQELCMSDLTFLRSFTFDNLNALRITSVTVQTLLQLNGPNTFRGTARLSELCVGLSVYLMDKDCINDMQVDFRDLIDALGCDRLSTLKVKLEHESYCLIHSPIFDVQLLVDQLSSLQSTLKVLEIDLDPLDDTDEWNYVLKHCKNVGSSMDKFRKLELLKIPQDFLFGDIESEYKIMPSDLPKKLRRLEIICPDEDIVPWAKFILNAPDELEDLRELFLRCRDEVKTPASTFSTGVKPVWPDLLFMCDITSYIIDLTANTTKSLPTLYEDDPGESDDEDEESEHGLDEVDKRESDSGDSEDESDEDMPDLEPFEAFPSILTDDLD
ncbi:uncharacterized protein CC84DRAFT_1164095 [Paraphaeosphaeria sporulosa]|uniref:F-box domain-containing protein n=1 Tax=Paraphaeosphaeria sporulosa TaxID=1460663 RepID=A0A177CFV6_9PLEO|nr:uncharacterized protein CC84DRAFT_1164095 [Paraphaeosphaeria sporulosa]OAG05610.1 hypothetical protein CC84DRAFT_1164095 [Paraphaeosphaeria sporulosa]